MTYFPTERVPSPIRFFFLDYECFAKELLVLLGRVFFVIRKVLCRRYFAHNKFLHQFSIKLKKKIISNAKTSVLFLFFTGLLRFQ